MVAMFGRIRLEKGRILLGKLREATGKFDRPPIKEWCLHSVRDPFRTASQTIIGHLEYAAHCFSSTGNRNTIRRIIDDEIVRCQLEESLDVGLTGATACTGTGGVAYAFETAMPGLHRADDSAL